MKIGEVKTEEKPVAKLPVDNSKQVPVTLEESSPEEAAHAMGISKNSPEYADTVERLKRLKKTDPKLYRKIVNFD